MYLNAAFYQFSSWPGYRTARAALRERGLMLGLKGTILLSPEGVNGSLCGTADSVRSMIGELRQQPELASLKVRETWSEAIAFKRLKIKLKQRIISMGTTDADPMKATGWRLAPVELKRWLDEGRDVLLVDTRNAFEVREGTFRGSLNLGLGHFHDFPDRLESIRQAAAGRPVVMFCTGGIRCERATALAQDQGMEQVYQLDGGILGYFESCGADHFEGNCFVFDEREKLRPEVKRCS